MINFYHDFKFEAQRGSFPWIKSMIAIIINEEEEEELLMEA
jgi:hypothetical protein